MKKTDNYVVVKLDIERKGYDTLKTGVVLSEESWNNSKFSKLDAILLQLKREIRKSKIL